MSTAAVTSTGSTFFEQLAAAPDRLLLLDYDGTLAPFCCDRRRATPYPTVPELLDSIMSTCRTRVVLISGRAAHEIPPLLGLRPHPEIWGTYGFERLQADGEYRVGRLNDSVKHALTEAELWLQAEGLESLVERKPAAVAVHWRGLPASMVEEVRTKAYQVLAPFACQGNLLLTETDDRLEVRARGFTKDHVVRSLMCETTAGCAVAYLGDDVCDEEAFREVNRQGLSVLVRDQLRPTAAQMWLRPPNELVQFLGEWVRSCGGEV